MPQAPVDPARGWASDAPAEELPPGFLTTVKNAFNREGVIGRAEAFAKLYGEPVAAPRYLLPNQDIGIGAYWIVASNGQVGVVDGSGVHKAITPTGYGSHGTLGTQPFSGGVINQLPVLNSPLSGPWYWQQDYATPGAMIALPGWPATQTCGVMRPFREFLIAMDITRNGVRFPDLLAWSDAAPPGDVPQSWTADVTTQAGEVSVSFNPGEIVDGAQLVDRFYVYKPTSVYVMTLVGGTFVFNQRPVFATFGALGKGCVVEWRGRHIVLTDGDLLEHDGTNVRSLAVGRVRNEIFGPMSDEYYGNSYLVLDKANHRLLIFRPRSGEQWPGEAITLDLDDLSFGHQDIITSAPHAADGIVDTPDANAELTWAAKTTTWANDPTRWSAGLFSRVANAVVFADFTDDTLKVMGVGNDHDGTPIESVIERTNIRLGNPNRRKYIRRVFPRFYGADGNDVLIQIGTQQTPTSGVEWGAEQTFRIGEDRHVSVDAAGFLVAFRMRTVGAGIWRLSQFELEFEWAGLY